MEQMTLRIGGACTCLHKRRSQRARRLAPRIRTTDTNEAAPGEFPVLGHRMGMIAKTYLY